MKKVLVLFIFLLALFLSFHGASALPIADEFSLQDYNMLSEFSMGEECAGGIATGSVVKDGRSIMWKNRHRSGGTGSSVNNYPSVNCEGTYCYITIFGYMSMNEKGLAVGNFDEGYQTLQNSQGTTDGTVPFGKALTDIVKYFSTVSEAVNYLTNHTNGSTQFIIVSAESGVGAVVGTDRRGGITHYCVSWINNSYAAISNTYYCDGVQNSKAQRIAAMFDDIVNNGGINGDGKIDWEEIAQRGGKNVGNQEQTCQGSETINTLGHISQPTCPSAFIAVSGNPSYDGAINTAWLAMGRQPLVGVWLPLGVSYVNSEADVPLPFHNNTEQGGIEDYVDVKVAYASTCGTQGCATYYCDKTNEVQSYTNHNEDYGFDKYDEFMEAIADDPPSNQAEAETRLEAFADSAFDVALYAYEHEFKTPFVPTDAQASVQGQTQIDLTWTKGEGSNRTIVERGSIPGWSMGEGVLVCNTTGGSCSDTGLSPSTHYYYQFWSYSVASDGAFQYSLDFDSADATTLAGGDIPEESGVFYVANDGNDAWRGNVTDGDFNPSGCEDDDDSSDCTNGPWKTISKVLSALDDGTIGSDDGIYFNRGDVFTSAEPFGFYVESSAGVTIGAYGIGNGPVLRVVV